MYYILTGKSTSAEEAERIGAITKAVEDAKNLDEAIEDATVVASNPRLGVLAGRESVNQHGETPLIPGLRLERCLFHGLFRTPDQNEGIADFVERREPDYTKR